MGYRYGGTPCTCGQSPVELLPGRTRVDVRQVTWRRVACMVGHNTSIPPPQYQRIVMFDLNNLQYDLTGTTVQGVVGRAVYVHKVPHPILLGLGIVRPSYGICIPKPISGLQDCFPSPV